MLIYGGDYKYRVGAVPDTWYILAVNFPRGATEHLQQTPTTRILAEYRIVYETRFLYD